MREDIVEELGVGNTWADATAKIGVSADAVRIPGPLDVRTEDAMHHGEALKQVETSIYKCYRAAQSQYNRPVMIRDST